MMDKQQIFKMFHLQWIVLCVFFVSMDTILCKNAYYMDSSLDCGYIGVQPVNRDQVIAINGKSGNAVSTTQTGCTINFQASESDSTLELTFDSFIITNPNIKLYVTGISSQQPKVYDLTTRAPEPYLTSGRSLTLTLHKTDITSMDYSFALRLRAIRENSDLDKCRPGQYGQNCDGTCGHCIDGNTTCSFTDGSCLAGCASGYDYVIDMSCKTECQHGFYGLNCSETCGPCIHGATTCSVIDGTCPSGCKPGYNPADSTCKTGVNILRASGFSVNTSQSSQYLDSDSSRAIDGLKGPDPDTCNCCSQTQNAEVSWWQVDMGVVLPIGEIVLYGQNDTRYQQLSLSGFSVYLSTSVSFPDVPFVKAHNDVDNATYHIDVLGNYARYVRIQRNGVLMICEVEIFLSDKTCPPSTYTVYCIPCGHCIAGLPCDDITGRCPNGCETGYAGDTCNQAINTGTSYGTKDVIGAGIGGAIGGAIFILLIVMLVLRRKKLRCPWVCQTSQDYESPKPRENRDDQNMYDVLDIPDLSDQSVSGINPATPHYQNTNI